MMRYAEEAGLGTINVDLLLKLLDFQLGRQLDKLGIGSSLCLFPDW